jgi:23S rRNA pseudouridine2457 synthase
MLSQFTPEAGHATLSDLYKFPTDVYPVGRLDSDSEGLLLLTNDTSLNNRLLNPKMKHNRTYLVQVEGIISDSAIDTLKNGTTITVNGKAYSTLPSKVTRLAAPPFVADRNPPIRVRKNIPESWITLSLIEGKNRQVRKMTASVGFPTLRLIRISIEKIELGEMKPSEVIEMKRDDVYRLLKINLK